ncbi:hypothetical protein IJ425_06000 [bacterium]|nr:hypothetical protein [bacterium]
MNKKFLILLLILVLIVSFFAAHKSIANNEISQDNIKKIEEETQACLDKGITMHNCNYDAINKYGIEIEKILKKFKNKLSQSQYKKLLISQQKWEEFAKANNELYSEIYDTIPATIVHLFGSQYKKQIYENRLKELIELYNEYNVLLNEYDAKKYY